MKRILLTTAVLGITLTGIAQEKYVTSANVALKAQNLDEAKENIDKAMASPEMQEKPKALLAKGEIYMSLMASEKYRNAFPYRDAAQALIKLAEVKPDYEKDDVDQMLIIAGALYYNDGVGKYTSKSYADAVPLFKNVVKIHELNGGKRFEKFPRVKSIDSAAARASMYIALCIYSSKNYSEAIPLLVAAKDNPMTKSSYLYGILIDAYRQANDKDKELATIQEARVAFPADQNFRNDELNYYIISGKQDELLKKLEAESAKDPGNAEFLFSIGIVYTGMANPKTGAKPANRQELLNKAEDAYQKALKLAPDNADMNYNYGAMFNNEAKELNDQMNALGTSAKEMKQYDELKVKRDALFNKALPYVEKAYNLLDPKAATLTGSEKNSYSGSLLMLSQIYSIQNKMDKYKEVKDKMKAK